MTDRMPVEVTNLDRARLGFRTLDLATISSGLQAVRESEAEAGLPMEHRICMQLDLS